MEIKWHLDSWKAFTFHLRWLMFRNAYIIKESLIRFSVFHKITLNHAICLLPKELFFFVINLTFLPFPGDFDHHISYIHTLIDGSILLFLNSSQEQLCGLREDGSCQSFSRAVKVSNSPLQYITSTWPGEITSQLTFSSRALSCVLLRPLARSSRSLNPLAPQVGFSSDIHWALNALSCSCNSIKDLLGVKTKSWASYYNSRVWKEPNQNHVK